MSPLIKKEIRLLLPAWGIAMLLSVLPAMFIGVLWISIMRFDPVSSYYEMFNSVVPLAFALGVVPLGLASFGQEFSAGTFTVLLSQPAERLRIWRTKINILALAFLSVWLVAIIMASCQYYYFTHGGYLSVATLANMQESKKVVFMYFTFSSLVAFSGGLWSTLLLRQVGTAFWLTLIFPVAIIAGIGSLLSFWMKTDQDPSHLIILALLVYSIAGFFIARKLFLRSQDVQWTGGDIVFPWQGKVSETASTSLSSRPRPWLFALVWKEIQLHQVNILIALVLLVINLTSYFTRKIHPHFQEPNVQFIFETIWVLWLLMPLLIGCAAVAEERRMGVMESQLCLPVSRRMQFLVKFSTALLLSLFLGGLMPLLLKVDAHLNGWIFGTAAAIFFISFYASTFARSVLQALGLAITIAAVVYVYLVVFAIDVLRLGIDSNANPAGFVVLKLYLGIPILALVFARMAFWNFKWLHQYAKCFRRNTAVVVSAFVFIFVLTNFIYFRAWEYLSSIEPSAGPARLYSPTNLKFSSFSETLYARLPDGRIWIDNLASGLASTRWGQAEVLLPGQSHAYILAGMDWSAVSADSFQALGIQANGTLWSLQRKWDLSKNHWFQTNVFNVTQIGSDTNWAEAADTGGVGFLMTKKDGSLWRWGSHDYDWRNSSKSIPHKLDSDLSMPPTRVGNETNWITLFPTVAGASLFATKSDGTLWRWDHNTAISPTLTNSYYNLSHVTFLAGPWSSIILGDYGGEGIKTNGSLWAIRISESGTNQNRKERRVEEQIGKDARWKSVGSHWGAIYAIRDDGTLWKWSSGWSLGHMQEPVQLGNRSDWVSLDTSWLGSFAVAADGSLWAWDQPSKYIWLAPSRKPLYLGNILDGAPANQ